MTDNTLVERLEEEAARLSGHSLDHGSVDAGIASNLASEASDRISLLEAEVERLTKEVEEARAQAGKLHDTMPTCATGRLSTLRDALTPFAQEKMPSLKMTELAYNSFGLRCLTDAGRAALKASP